MAFDMIRDAMEIKWVIPQIKKFKGNFKKIIKNKKTFDVLLANKVDVHIIDFGKTILFGSSHRKIDFAEFHLLTRFYYADLGPHRGGIFLESLKLPKYAKLSTKIPCLEAKMQLHCEDYLKVRPNIPEEISELR